MILLKNKKVIYQSWYDLFQSSFQVVWEKIFASLPNIFLAVIVFVIGYVLAHALAKTISSIIGLAKIDNTLAKFKVDHIVSRFGWRLDAGKFFGELVKWFLMIVFLLVTADILGLVAVSQFLNSLLLYIPNVVVAAIVILITVLVANFLQKVVIASASAAQLTAANFAGTIVKWAILIVGILMAVEQLGISQIYLQTLYTGIVALIAIGGGLAFGLGGKEQAAAFLARLGSQIRERE